MGLILTVIDPRRRGMGQKNVKPLFPLQLQPEFTDPLFHFQRSKLTIYAGNVTHRPSQAQNPYSLILINIIINADAAFRRSFFILDIVIAPHIQKGTMGKRHQKRQVFRRQITTGQDQIDIFKKRLIKIVIVRLGNLISYYQYLHPLLLLHPAHAQPLLPLP